MTDSADNLVLEHLRPTRVSVDALRSDTKDMRDRLSAVELGLAAVRREMAALAEQDAHLAARVDRVGDRMDRIEMRLGLADQ